jgi:hypothetical protein
MKEEMACVAARVNSPPTCRPNPDKQSNMEE